MASLSSILRRIDSEWRVKSIRSTLDTNAFEWETQKWFHFHTCKRKSVCVSDMITCKDKYQCWFLYSNNYRGSVCCERIETQDDVYYMLDVSIINRNTGERILKCSISINQDGYIYSDFPKFGWVDICKYTGYETIVNYQVKGDERDEGSKFEIVDKKGVNLVNQGLFLRVLNHLCKFPVNELLYSRFQTNIAELIIIYFWDYREN